MRKMCPYTFAIPIYSRKGTGDELPETQWTEIFFSELAANSVNLSAEGTFRTLSRPHPPDGTYQILSREEGQKIFQFYRWHRAAIELETYGD
jgi:hypothetical protein